MHPTMIQMLAEARIQDLSRDTRYTVRDGSAVRRHRALHRRSRGQF